MILKEIKSSFKKLQVNERLQCKNMEEMMSLHGKYLKIEIIGP